MSKATRVIAAALLVAAFIPAPFAAAEMTADEIVGKYVEAIGGKDAIAKIKNRKTVGKFSLPDMGLEAPMVTIIEGGNMWSEINVESMGMMVHRGITDGTAWELNPMQGPRVLEGGEKIAMMRQADVEPWANWKDYFASAEVAGEEEMDGKTVYKVVFTPKEGDAETYMFDKESGLLVGSETTVEGMTSAGTISEYKEFDGVKVATKIEQGGAMGTVIISFEEIMNNTEIDKSKFTLPEEIKALAGN